MKVWLCIALWCMCICTSTIAQSTHFADSLAAISDIPDPGEQYLRLTRLTVDPQLQPFHDTLSLAYHRLAYAAEDMGDMQAAIRANTTALHLRTQVLTSDPETYCRSAFNLGRNYAFVHQLDSARFYFTYVLSASPVMRQKSISAHEISKTYLTEREFTLAREFAIQALAFAQQGDLGHEQQSAYVLLLDGFNIMLHDGGALHVADSIIRYAQFSRDYFAKLNKPLSNSALRHLSKLRYLESNAYKAKEDYDTALRLIDEAAVLLGQISESLRPTDRTFSSEIFNSRGILLRRLGNYEAARQALDRALAMRLEVQDNINAAVTHNNIGDVFANQKRYAEAIEHYETSVVLLTGIPGGATTHAIVPSVHSVMSHPMLPDLFKYLAYAAHGWLEYCIASGDTPRCTTALRFYAAADSLVDIMRSRHLRESSKLLWRDDAKRMYGGAIDAAVRTGRNAEVLYYSDRSKAILVLDAVREHMIRDTPLRSLLEKRDSIRQALAATTNDPGTGEDWMTLTTRMETINRTLHEAMPLMFNLEEHVLSVREVLRDSGEAIIHFFEGEDALWACVADHHQIRVVALDREAVRKAMDTYRSAILSFIRQGVVETQHHGSRELFALLIAPLGDLPGRLVIVPDGAMSHVAFDGLIDGEGQFLIETKTIRYELSLAMAHALKRLGPDPGASHIRAFAPMTAARCDHGALPFTREELRGIASHAAGVFYYGDAASRQQFFADRAVGDILHLASHAASSPDNTASWIALAGDTADCAFLYVRDLYMSHVPAAMVVVSACEGAYGAYASGEGAMTIARGFLLAGARSLVTSLWQVNDAATAEIMTAFYAYLSQGLSKSDALRLARLDYLRAPGRKKSELHPAMWSGYVVIGNDAPVLFAKPQKHRLFYILITGGIALLVILCAQLRRRKTT